MLALGEDPETAGPVLDLQRQLFVVAADLMANPRARGRLTDGVSRVGPQRLLRAVVFLNRLSDLLYVLARRAAGTNQEPISHD